MSNSVRPHRRQPTRLPYPWDSPGKNTGAGCHFLLQCMKVKSLSHVRLHRWEPTRLPRPWDSPSKNTGVGCHFLLQCMKVKSVSRVQLLATPWTAAHQAAPSMGFPRQEYWSGVTAWLSFIELVKAVVHVIRLASFLWLWFQSACPLRPSLSAFRLTGFLLPWMWGISSQQSTAAAPDLGRGVIISLRPPLLTLDVGYLDMCPFIQLLYHVFKIHQILIQQRSHLGSPGTQVSRLVPIYYP